jgi:hypothetical protein
VVVRVNGDWPWKGKQIKGLPSLRRMANSIPFHFHPPLPSALLLLRPPRRLSPSALVRACVRAAPTLPLSPALTLLALSSARAPFPTPTLLGFQDLAAGFLLCCEESGH